MKSTLIQALIVALLLAEEGQAYKLMQKVMIRDDNLNSEEIDADDPDINDASMDDEKSL
jgi:hypothetical protein